MTGLGFDKITSLTLRGKWNETLSDFWKMLMQPGLKYLRARVTVYPCLHYCLKRTTTSSFVNCEN